MTLPVHHGGGNNLRGKTRKNVIIVKDLGVNRKLERTPAALSQ
jgi:hypothetical protein